MIGLERPGRLGNDIVDLTAPEAIGKAAEHRFVRRVCNPSERRWLEAEQDPTRSLWRLFAAKEATFKAAKKYWPEVSVGFGCIGVNTEWGFSTVNGHRAELRFEERDTYIHCVAWLGGARRQSLLHRVITVDSELGDAERTTELSRLMRQLVRERLFQRYGVVEIRRDAGPERWRAPEVHRSGDRLRSIEVSFSHDGPFGAVVVSRSLPAR